MRIGQNFKSIEAHSYDTTRQRNDFGEIHGTVIGYSEGWVCLENPQKHVYFITPEVFENFNKFKKS